MGEPSGYSMYDPAAEAAKLRRAEALAEERGREIEAWRGHFRALVAEDRPDTAGNAVIGLRQRVEEQDREIERLRREVIEAENLTDGDLKRFLSAALDGRKLAEAKLALVVGALESSAMRLDQLGWSLETTAPRETLARLAHSERDVARAALAAAQPEEEKRRCDGNHAMPPCADPECWNR